MTDDNRVANVRVSHDLLKEWMHLPDGCEILRVFDSNNRPFEFVVTVRHPDLEPVREGCIIPFVTPLYRTVSTPLDAVSVTVNSVEFQEW